MNPQPNSPTFRELPTTSLYLKDALRADGLEVDWEAHRSGPFSFRFGDRLVVIRYATGPEVELAGRVNRDGGRVIYLVDDDLEAIAADTGLPDDYRSRIGAFLSGPWKDLKEHVGEAVVSSPVLAERLRRQGIDRVTELDPYWPIPSAEVADSKEPLRIGWLCTRSHQADLDSVSSDLSAFLKRHRDLRLTLHLGKKHPAWIRKSKGIENLDPLPWPEYRAWLSGRRFDLALYPLLDTAVNRSRSINKFLEHAVAGAATILSPGAPFAGRLEEGTDCLVAEEGQWLEMLESLLADRGRIPEIANRARVRAREIAEVARRRQAAFWKDRLPLLESHPEAGVRR